MRKKIFHSIEVAGVTKEYLLRSDRPSLLKKFLKPQNTEINKRFAALEGVSLTIKKGEKVGIIGSNGSGKTTLLKIISGVTTPTRGRVVTRGRLVSLIDLGAGFYPELTGKENVILNGMLVGMSRNEVLAKYDDILAFADIGSFINMPLFSYSEGMKLRLGFSVAVATKPDILVLDEGIAAGDDNFQRKSLAKIEELYSQDRTIITATHWMNYLRKRKCNRILWLERGSVYEDGGIDLIDKYKEKYRREYELVTTLHSTD